MFEKLILANFLSTVAATDLEICSEQTSTGTTCDKGPRKTLRANLSLDGGKQLPYQVTKLILPGLAGLEEV